MIRLVLSVLVALILFAPPIQAAEPAAAEAPAQPPDTSIYADLLQKYVKAGVVNYGGFKSEEDRFDSFLRQIGRVNPESLSREDEYAYWINAYNAWTIKLILTGYPGVKSIKDLGGFWGPWKKRFVKAGGKTLTLDEIEHKILRPRFKDPRVHFAVNCASKGCPPLRSEPYEGAGLDAQLNDQTASFINDPIRTRLDRNRLYVSRIFKWFSEDFDDDPVGFVIRYAAGDFRNKLLLQRNSLDVKYMDYDWSLNGY